MTVVNVTKIIKIYQFLTDRGRWVAIYFEASTNFHSLCTRSQIAVPAGMNSRAPYPALHWLFAPAPYRPAEHKCRDGLGEEASVTLKPLASTRFAFRHCIKPSWRHRCISHFTYVVIGSNRQFSPSRMFLFFSFCTYVHVKPSIEKRNFNRSRN